MFELRYRREHSWNNKNKQTSWRAAQSRIARPTYTRSTRTTIITKRVVYLMRQDYRWCVCSRPRIGYAYPLLSWAFSLLLLLYLFLLAECSKAHQQQVMDEPFIFFHLSCERNFTFSNAATLYERKISLIEAHNRIFSFIFYWGMQSHS